MEENVIGVAAIIAAFLVLFYVNKWDLVDMTGLAKKSAIAGMPALSDTLSMGYEKGRTHIRQGELSLKRKRFTLKVLPDLNRIEISFTQALGVFLLNNKDKRKNDRDGKLEGIHFQRDVINGFFVEKVVANAKAKRRVEGNDDLETALAEFITSWDGRKLTSFALRDDTLHVVFAYNGYLPLPLIEEVTPLLIAFSEAIVATPRGES